MGWEEVMLHHKHQSQQCLPPERVEDMKSGCLLLNGSSEGWATVPFPSRACHALGTSATLPGLCDTGQKLLGKWRLDWLVC